MLTLDLFNTRHERELQEGAVDNTIARLIEPLHRRAADIRTELRGGNLTSMRRAHLEREYQDLVDKRLEIINGPKPVHSEPQTDECMGYGTLVGETGLPDVADKKAKMARLNQPGKVGTDVVKPQQRVNPNPNKGIVGHAADWLRGKGGPGKEGPTYESELDEEGTYDIPPQYMFVLDQIKAGFDEGKPYVEITLPNRETVPMTRPQMFNVLATFGNMNRKQLKKTMVRFFDTKRDMLLMLGSPVIKRYQTPPLPKPVLPQPGQGSLGLDDPNKIAEAQKKNSPEADLSGNTARDPVVARELRKMRGRQPSASSDIEALVRDEMDQAERTEQTIAQQQTEIDRQQQQLTQLIQANQTQSSDITAQGREIDNLSRDLQRAVADLQAAKVAPTPAAEPAQPKAEPTAAEPAYMPPPVPQATAVDADVQKQIQDLSKDLTMATLKMKEPGVSQAEHDKLQQAVTTLRSEIEKLKQSKPAKAPGKLNYKKVQPKSAKPKRAGDDAKFMGNVDQGAAQLAHDPYDFSQYSTMAKPVRPARKVAQQVELGLDEGAMSELDIERQDLERMTDQQFLKNYGISKEFWKYKNQAVLKKPARRPMSAQLARSPVGKKMNAMYGSTCPGCGRSTNPDRCVCEGLTESDNPKMDQLIKMIQAGKITAAGLKDPAVRPRIMQLVQQAGPEANIEQLIATYAPAAQVKATNVNDLKSAARRGVVNAPYPRTSAGTPGYSQQHSTFEGFQDFNKVEPYAVCLAGKPVKKFDYYEQARQFHDNWKKKLYREGNKEKADKITLMPIMKEATNRHFGPKGAGTELARQIKSNGDLDRTKQPEPTGVYKKNEFDITRPKTKIQVKKNKGVAEGLTEFALSNGDNSDNFDPKLATMAKKEGVVKGYSLVDHATVEQALEIPNCQWGDMYDGQYKQYFVKGFINGRKAKLEQARKDGVALTLQKDGRLSRVQQGVAEMDKSQKGPAGWNIDDYDYSKGKWSRGKIMTAKDAVKSATKDLAAAFDQADKKKPKPVKESYWTKLQNERNTRLNSLVNELAESIKK